MTSTALNKLRAVDRCFDPSTATQDLLALVHGDEWTEQQAALHGIASRPDPSAVAAILETLDRQEALDLYGGTYEQPLADAPNDTVREQWRCRFRVKQAACIALGAIGEQSGAGALEPQAVDRLMRYAVDQGEDYPVRAAACHALGRSGVSRAAAVLEQAAADTEWCTAAEAKRALARVRAG